MMAAGGAMKMVFSTFAWAVVVKRASSARMVLYIFADRGMISLMSFQFYKNQCMFVEVVLDDEVV